MSGKLATWSTPELTCFILNGSYKTNKNLLCYLLKEFMNIPWGIILMDLQNIPSGGGRGRK